VQPSAFFLEDLREMMFRLEKTLGSLTVLLLLLSSSLISLAGAATQGVALDWEDNDEPDMDYYNIYRSISTTGPYVKINTAGVRVSTYQDGNVEAGKVYYYKVTAVTHLPTNRISPTWPPSISPPPYLKPMPILLPMPDPTNAFP
jgi:hypothetical protein